MGSRLLPVKRKRMSAPVLPLEGKFSAVIGPEVAVTVTVTDWEVEPPGPEHSSENVLEAESAPVEAEPLVDLVPLQEPPAEQEVALVEDHERVVAEPL
ncbi:MAG: hypothetical protein KIT17_18420 [Rubrivivax sp.]|uniref:hypothetical protein n=1 Tax=Piscinibacter sp. TaxID=1903157 RepID=UPI00258C6013|nr:hypothetical protein [Piscinibacter sp.]MCW5635318.1 hypothetical protein [Rubrivivax sp.]MCW5662479.1 hypothetical protein [Piscinibacter sp.]